MMKLRSFYLLIILLLINIPFSSAQYRPVEFGPRPYIDIQSLPQEAFEPGKLRIQFTQTAGYKLDANPIKVFADRVEFGISTVDSITNLAGIIGAVGTFSGPSMKSDFTERHRLWGLHLWYDIELKPSASITEAILLLSQLPEIALAEPVFRKQIVGGHVFEWDNDAFFTRDEVENWSPNDPQFISQWHYHNTGQTGGTSGADIDLINAWQIEKGNSDVIVAIIDDGIQFNHPDLQANMWEGIGFNFVDNNSTVIPGDHGTHVAGTVAAVSNNAVGVSGIAGGAGEGDGVRLMSAQVFRGNSSGGFPASFIWAADNGAAIAQNSWGYTVSGVFEQAVLNAIDYFNVNGGGDVLDGGITLFAAGNSNASGAWYPGYYPGAIAVAATNHNDQKAWYSNFGPWVEISAPGGETNSVNNRGVLSTVTNSGYAFYQGTSMACPHASGVAALVLSNAPGVFTNHELREILVSATDFHYPVNPSFTGQLGSGRINAYKALQEVENFMAGLINPAAFSATALSTEQIALSWELNPSQHEILLAYSFDGLFGTPASIYDPGDTLAGGGIVLYTGVETTFIHDSLDPTTTVFYKIWSRGEELYSSGRLTIATTLCGLLDLPVDEKFDTAQIPLCWEVTDNAGSGRFWQVGSFSDGLNIPGNYAYSGTGIGGGKNTDLISPAIDLTNYQDITVSFSHYFRAFFLGGSEATFAYSLDNGLSWTTVQSWTTTTANPASFEAVIPELAGQPMVRLRWNMQVGLLGFYWTVGNISITGTLLEKPLLVVDQQEISVDVDAGQTLQFGLTIGNQGNADLQITDVSINYPNEFINFIILALDDETVVPGDSTNLILTFDSGDLDDGTYFADLVIQTNDPEQEEVTIPITMVVLPGEAPTAEFSSTNSIIQPGGQIQFFDLSAGEITEWFWDFPGGEPMVSELQNPSVVYDEPGEYDVKLRVTNRWGYNELIRESYVVVETPSFVVDADNPLPITIAPNPSDGRFTILSHGQKFNSVEIRNLQGITVYQSTSLLSAQKTINLARFAPGVYIITLLNDKVPIHHDRIVIRY